MDRDDPDERIADLERQHVETAEQPRPEQLRRSKRGSRGRPRWGRVLKGLALAGIPTIIVCSLVYNTYEYRVGTPTTATNVDCVDHQSHSYRYGSHSWRRCYGTWSLNGHPYFGEIVGASEPGGSLDVRARGGTAFTTDAVHNNVLYAVLAVVGGIVAFAIGYNYQSPRAARAARERALARETEVPEGFTRVRCWVCQHVQTVPVGQEELSCEQCGASLKRRTSHTEGT
jgi:ribosomal protein S27E